MPYNTRRKSVSLASLGIHIPNRSRASSNRTPPVTTAGAEQQPPPKKLKRSHSLTSASDSLASPSRPLPPKFGHERRRSAARVAENTPPPSPGEPGGFKIDTEGIKDDIVVGVIDQLEKTGNRPHLLKELAAVLSNTIPVVESSANQSAIISSRLSAYLRRPWTALAPCPLGKKLVGTHPKRIYFYLTSQHRQPFPEAAESPTSANRIVSPSLTSAENEDEDEDAHITRHRSELSPSPEIDLSSPEFDHHDPPMSGGASFPAGGTVSRASTHDGSRSTMAHGQTSPALERDEREFTQTASSLQQRRKSESMDAKAESKSLPVTDMADVIVLESEESEERAAQRNKEAAAVLFGHSESVLSLPPTSFMESSPMLRPRMEVDSPVMKRPTSLSYEMRDVHLSDLMDTNFCCENLQLDELDDLFQSY